MTKWLEREEARRLPRDRGMPLNEIAGRLGVAKSSVSQWVRDIELTAEQIADLRERNPIFNQQHRGQQNRAASARAVRRAAQASGRALARVGDPLHRAGCMLYWAEGARSRTTLCFVNTDPAMLRHFLRFCARATDSRTTRCGCTETAT